MSYKIDYDIDLDKALAKIPKRDAKFIKEKIESLANSPRPYGSIKLSGKELYRIRHGIYRIIYRIFDDRLIVLVLDVDSRKKCIQKIIRI
jgi:mRNA interferase RelE/StbE